MRTNFCIRKLTAKNSFIREMSIFTISELADIRNKRESSLALLFAGDLLSQGSSKDIRLLSRSDGQSSEIREESSISAIGERRLLELSFSGSD